MKEQLPKQVYTTEFREQAVLLVTRDGLSIAEAARRLSMSLKTRSLLGQARQSWTASGGERRCQPRSARDHRRAS